MCDVVVFDYTLQHVFINLISPVILSPWQYASNMSPVMSIQQMTSLITTFHPCCSMKLPSIWRT